MFCWISFLIELSFLVTITYVNCYSVNLATSTQNIFTAAKLLAIIIIVIGGIVHLAQGNTELITKGFEGSKWKTSELATAFYSGLWAYDGWYERTSLNELFHQTSFSFSLQEQSKLCY